MGRRKPEVIAREIGVKLAEPMVGEGDPLTLRGELGELRKKLRSNVEIVDIAASREELRKLGRELDLDLESFARVERLFEWQAKLGAVLWDELIFGRVEPLDTPNAERVESDLTAAFGLHSAERPAAFAHKHGAFITERVRVEMKEEIVEARLAPVGVFDAEEPANGAGLGIEANVELVVVITEARAWRGVCLAAA